MRHPEALEPSDGSDCRRASAGNRDFLVLIGENEQENAQKETKVCKCEQKTDWSKKTVCYENVC